MFSYFTSLELIFLVNANIAFYLLTAHFVIFTGNRGEYVNKLEARIKQLEEERDFFITVSLYYWLVFITG